MMTSVQDKQRWAWIIALGLVGLLFIPLSQTWLGVEYSYTVRTVALGGAVLGLVSGVLGCFAVLRRESLLGDALSHAALPGVAIAFLVAGRNLIPLLIGAGIASGLGVQFIRRILATTRLKQDAAMGIVLTSWFAAGIALLVYIQARPDASQAGLDGFIFGQAAAIVASDVQLISAVGGLAFVVLVLFWKEFKLVTFDLEFARANGYPVNFINSLLFTLIVTAIVLGLQLAGVILMVGMLIAPGIAARQWTQKLHQMVVLAGLFGAFAGGVGAVISAVDADIPTGPMIIVVAFTLVILSLALAPERGLLWTAWQQRQDRRRFAAQRVLRELHRYARAHGGEQSVVPAVFIRGTGGPSCALGLRQLLLSEYIVPEAKGFRLTASGLEAARDDARNQQLWEAYRAYHHELALPLIREDRYSDIRVALPAPAIAQLEAKLIGRLA